MAGGAPPPGGGGPSAASSQPKILLTKPPSISAVNTMAPGRREEDSSVGTAGGGGAGPTARSSSRSSPHPASLSLLSAESWELQIDRVLPFLTENNDFVVVGVIGPAGVGKSTILNELYGYDATSPGMVLPFATQTDEMRALARHCSTGIELRVSNERLILLDTQPVFSPTVLADMIKPDGSCAIPVMSGEPLSAEMAHELMGIQMALFLASVCNIVLIVSERINDISTWQLMLTVDLMKHKIPDPSQALNFAPDKDNRSTSQANSDEYMSDLVFVHTKLREQDFSPPKLEHVRKTLYKFLETTSFASSWKSSFSEPNGSSDVSGSNREDSDAVQQMFFIPNRATQEGTSQFDCASYSCAVASLRDRILSMNPRSFSKNISERDWLRGSAKIWDLVKKSPVISNYCNTLQEAGLFRK
ncbi:Protein SMG9 [Rhynchospora pubera]|uniref:Protein SMG9 n=1 Tax=Rhynchospora pubera TaxID=906938 RepID=A0AAV8GIG7_9POAL|nr:Protein SMG9 [Rhynchospora pubera]